MFSHADAFRGYRYAAAIQLAAFYEHATPTAEIGAILVDIFTPGLSMAIGKHEEEPLGLGAAAQFQALDHQLGRMLLIKWNSTSS